jgi:Complex1_LYR-like
MSTTTPIRTITTGMLIRSRYVHSSLTSSWRWQQRRNNNCFFSSSTTDTDGTNIKTNDGVAPNRTRILSLYRSILRLHNKALPSNLRNMGNTYVQSEFRTLKDTKKMTLSHVKNFMMEWEKYQQQIQYQYHQQQQVLEQQKQQQIFDTNTIKFGQPLPSYVQLTSEQQKQLRKLQQEVTTTTSTTADNKLG